MHEDIKRWPELLVPCSHKTLMEGHRNTVPSRVARRPGLFAVQRSLCWQGRSRYALRNVARSGTAPFGWAGALREMRAHEQTRLLPVVVFSSAQEPPQAGEIYAAGANSYIDLRPGFEPFEESIRHVAHYWCVVNDPPPPPPRCSLCCSL
jgi:hypothetical protein